MTGFNHGLTGAVIALSIKQPALAIVLAFLSHFVTDLVPHWNYGSNPDDHSFNNHFKLILASDFLLSVVLMGVLGVVFPAHRWLIWGCMVAAACPDLMWAYYFIYIEHIKKARPKFDWLAKLHIKVQWSQTPKGIYVECAWAITMGVLIFNFR